MQLAFNIFGFIAALIGIGTFLYKFICWYFKQLGNLFLFVICSISASTIGGFLWNVLCKLKNWPYHMGGSGNEPHDLHAFIWGVITIAPVIFLALLTSRKSQIEDWISLFKWIVSTDFIEIVLYSTFAGLGAVIFYDFGFRASIEAMHIGYAKQEIIIVLLWSGIISLTTYVSYLIFYPVQNLITKTHSNLFAPLLQVPFSMFLSFLAVLFFLCIAPYIPAFDQIRGLIAGLALRFGLFCGIIYSATRIGFKNVST